MAHRCHAGLTSAFSLSPAHLAELSTCRLRSCNRSQSSSLYLFTFLITILVLAGISGGLLFRAYYVRRRFQRRVEEAIRAGQPLPRDAARALGLNRPARKAEAPLGPMPGWWEAEMRLDRDAPGATPVQSSEKDWEGVVVGLYVCRRGGGGEQ